MEVIVNWGRIAIYAAALFVAQVSIGFLEGSLAGIGPMHLVASSAISFLACGAIFAHLAARQCSNPFVHAWAALILQSLAGAVFLFALTRRLDGVPPVTLAIEWLVLVCALMAGTALGSSWRRRTGQPAGG
ncbi:hypothetical protein GCM10027359_31760 [Marilutibacter aestuarii]